MPPKTVKVGPGTLTIGEVGTPLDFTAQVTSASVVWKKNKEDNTPVLSGEEVDGDVSYTATLKATVFQDLSDEGLVDYTWAHKGEVVPFTFTPSTAAGKAITGNVVVDPLDVGGDVKKKATSDLEWDCSGEPELAAGLG